MNGWRRAGDRCGRKFRTGNRLERRGLLRLDWGPDDTPDAGRMCWYLTDRARTALRPKTKDPEPS